MTPRNWLVKLSLAVAAIGILAPPLPAAVLYWQTATSGTINSGNYSTDNTTLNLSPVAADEINIGAAGTATRSAGATLNYAKLKLGVTGVGSNRNGAGTVTVSNGAKINLTAGAAGSANAGLIVGNTQTGTLNIDGANSSVTSNQLIVIGFATNQPLRNGTINITNGGSLISTAGNINMGDSGAGGDVGIQGHLFVDGTVSAMGSGADLNVGIRNTGATVTQTGGAINIADVIEVGFGGTGAHTNLNSSFSISGGTTTNGGNFFVGRGASSGAKVFISGSGTINVGNRYLMGSGSATGVETNHSAGTLNTVLDLRIGDGLNYSGDSTYNLSGTGIVNSNSTTTLSIVGRQGTGKFIQTGGTANFKGGLSVGNRDGAAGATNGLYQISGGNLNVLNGMSVAPNGVGQLRVIGDDAAIDVTGNFSLGNTGNGLGTLAYELESGDLLSVIDVSGTATFSAGSKLIFDNSNAAFTQGTYNLLTATDIIDNGISFTGPFNWVYQIVPGLNGEILQVTVIPEPGTLALALVGGIAALRCRRRS